MQFTSDERLGYDMTECCKLVSEAIKWEKEGSSPKTKEMIDTLDLKTHTTHEWCQVFLGMF